MNLNPYNKNHKSLRSLLLLVFALLFIGDPFQASALDPNRSIYQYNCRTWRRANGLPANAVTAIAQSADGRLWLGTSHGLVYFDGIGFRVFDLSGDGGIEGKVINSLARRSAGGLWFGLDRGSFGYFDKQQFHSLQQANWGGPFATVHSVQETHDGVMLFGGSGLAGRFTATNTLTSLLPINNADVFSVYEDSLGRIWMGTAQDGLFYWENGKLITFPDPTLRNMVISAVAVDQAGNIWVGTGNGLRRYNSNFQEGALTGFGSQPRALLVDRHGVLWIGTTSVGLIRYQDGKFTSLRKQDGLASDRILSLAESDDGSLWVGTEDGLSQLSDVKFPILTTTEGLANEACLAVAASPQGGIWAGTPDGVSYFHDGQFTNFGVGGADGLRSRWVKRLFAARNGDVYFLGGRKNIDRFRGDHVVMSWTNSVWPRALTEDSHGILVGMAGDLMRIENDKLVPVRLADGSNVSLNWINDLLVARDGSIWVAATSGVFQIKDGILYDWCRKNNLAQSAFFYMCEDNDGAIWAAQNTGIARFKNGGLQIITKQQGLHEDFVYAIVPDKFGNFWMDSNGGIFRVNQRELNAVADGNAEQVHCTVYEGEDAVKTTDKSAQDYSGCRSSDGRIWFPSSKGIIMVDPTNIPSNPQPPVVFIEEVGINGREYDPNLKPVLEPGPGNLEFDYSALDYQAPQKIQYRYKLDGYDSDWMDAGSRRTAFYTNIKPGDYRFQVQACNADGVWNITADSFSFKLPPRFHETIAFRVTVAVAGLGLVVYLWWIWHLRRKHAQLRQTRDLLESKVQERTSELRNEIEERKLMQMEVERVHQQLLEISRQAGMAEIATNVLHNVGNVLNSVNISTGLIVESVKTSRASSLAKVVILLREHAHDLGEFITNDPRGKHVPAHLAQLSEHLMADQEAIVGELDSLRRNVEHIKEIVAMQQNYATVGGVKEMINVVNLVEDSLRMNEGELNRHRVEVVREFEEVPPMNIEKHKILQILVNLVSNAKHACQESGRTDKRLTMRVGDGEGRIKISVTDNGVGIPPENLTRIFNHGFTTRKEGHGFGLHSGALAAKELGGSLTVQSEGLGKGATFTLELPQNTPITDTTLRRRANLQSSRLKQENSHE
jgi:ligand-binding sensor domain-containing protein/signal transduction histidine kinase